jgi:hypothetical protein
VNEVYPKPLERRCNDAVIVAGTVEPGLRDHFGPTGSHTSETFLAHRSGVNENYNGTIRNKAAAKSEEELLG